MASVCVILLILSADMTAFFGNGKAVENDTTKETAQEEPVFSLEHLQYNVGCIADALSGFIGNAGKDGITEFADKYHNALSDTEEGQEKNEKKAAEKKTTKSTKKGKHAVKIEKASVR